MAMELEFWVPDGPNGEALDFAVRVSAGTLVPQIDRFWRKDHTYAILRHTSRQKGEWIIRVRPGYRSKTNPVVGPLVSLGTSK